MKFICIVAALVSALCAAVAPVVAQDHLLPNPFLDISDAYKAPADRKYIPYYDALRARHVLEELRELLNPLRLPRQVKVEVRQCGAPTVAYKSGAPITICYEMIDLISQVAKKIYPQDTAAEQKMVVGAFIQAALHETAHAIFDVLNVPIWGREDDAADRLAALVMVEFGEDIAVTTILNTIILFQYSANAGQAWTGSDFANTASPDAQRFFNYVCMGVAADYPHFGGLVERGILPDNFRDCTQEYAQIRKAFDLRIMPYIDPDALVAARATQWLSWTPKQ